MKIQALIVGGLLACLLVLAACQGSARDTSPNVLSVSLSTGRLIAPDTVAGGWTHLRVEEDTAGHILVAFRLPATVTPREVASFLAALDTARMTPQPGVAIGGPEVGDSGEVIVYLKPGRYLLGCVRRANDAHRHASQGEARVLEVRSPVRGASPPEATQEVKMVDFAYGTGMTWRAGRQMIRVSNDGRQDHLLRMDRLPAGASMKDCLEAEGDAEVGETVAGVARTGPGQTVYLPVDLAPGVYVLYCLVPDAVSGKLHTEMGMMRTVNVQ